MAESSSIFPRCRCFACQERNVSRFVVNSICECCDYLDIDTSIILSSDLDKQNELKAEERVLDINRVVGARQYINPIGGTELYNKEHFAEKGIHLSFIKARNIPYKQYQNDKFVPFLSIIDVMMFNSKGEIANLLMEYDLQ